MTRRIITKAEFLDLYQADELIIKDILVTPIAIIAKTKPKKDYIQEIVIVNIP